MNRPGPPPGLLQGCTSVGLYQTSVRLHRGLRQGQMRVTRRERMIKARSGSLHRLPLSRTMAVRSTAQSPTRSRWADAGGSAQSGGSYGTGPKHHCAAFGQGSPGHLLTIEVEDLQPLGTAL